MERNHLIRVKRHWSFYGILIRFAAQHHSFAAFGGYLDNRMLLNIPLCSYLVQYWWYYNTILVTTVILEMWYLSRFDFTEFRGISWRFDCFVNEVMNSFEKFDDFNVLTADWKSQLYFADVWWSRMWISTDFHIIWMRRFVLVTAVKTAFGPLFTLKRRACSQDGQGITDMTFRLLCLSWRKGTAWSLR